MSRAYNAAGKRLSSMTHARRGHPCGLAGCDAVPFGNGGTVQHGRGHVRRGEAVELVKEHGAMQSPTRVFLAPGDPMVQTFLDRGFEQVAG